MPSWRVRFWCEISVVSPVAASAAATASWRSRPWPGASPSPWRSPPPQPTADALPAPAAAQVRHLDRAERGHDNRGARARPLGGTERVGWDVFPRQIGPNVFTYEAAQVGTNGKVISGPADIFATHWGSLEFPATLLGAGGRPLLVFSGQQGSTGPYSRGCVYGALGAGTAKWLLEPWSLSANCVNPVAAAAESNASAKVLAAAWPGGFAGGNGVLYRIGASPAIPAASADQHIALAKATAGQTAMVNDQAGNGHFYVGWTQVFSTPGGADGIYVRDVTAGVTRKAPGTGTVLSQTDFPVFGRLASVNRNAKGGGVYLAYCANKSPCSLDLWKAGAAKAMPVPSSANALGVTLAQGPGGRIWVVWYGNQSNKVFVTRTNRAATRFGVVRGYATPCAEDGLLGLGGSPLAKLDVGMSCLNNSNLKQGQYVAQVLAGLSLSFPGTVHLGSKGVTVKITVTDAGDPVPGATVKFAGKTLKTNAKGQVSVTLSASVKTGGYKIAVTAPNYAAAGGTVSVKR